MGGGISARPSDIEPDGSEVLDFVVCGDREGDEFVAYCYIDGTRGRRAVHELRDEKDG